MNKIYNNILELVGKTPLVRINNINDTEAEIIGKVEFFNPGGSVKDRIALAMIEAAEKKGLINKDTLPPGLKYSTFPIISASGSFI
jgi:cysteine synthase A